MKNTILFSSLIIITMILGSCTNTKKKTDETGNSDTMEEVIKDEWITLFDGNSFEGWRGYTKETLPSAWTIEDGAIKINGSGRGEAGAEDGGDIIYDRKFENFELTFEWKVSKGGNSGVFYLAQEIKGEPIYKSAPEYQV